MITIILVSRRQCCNRSGTASAVERGGLFVFKNVSQIKIRTLSLSGRSEI